MKRAGILNRHLSGALAMLGHTDRVTVCDAGLPIPEGPVVVDLSFRSGVPSFAEVLEGLLDEPVVEGATAARETPAATPKRPHCRRGGSRTGCSSRHRTRS